MDHAVVKHHHVIAHAPHAACVVRDDDRGAVELIPHLDDELVYAVRYHRIKPRGGFVVNDDFRLVNNRPRQTDPFAHAAGEFGRLFILCAGEIDEFQCLGHGLFDFSAGQGLLAVEQEADILLDGQRVEQRSALEQHAEFSTHLDQLPFIQLNDAFAVDFHVAGVGLDEADDVAQQDALAAATAPDDHRRLAAIYRQVHPGENLLCPVAFSQLADFNQSE